MSVNAIPRANRIAFSPASLPWLITAAIYVLLMLMGSRLLADPRHLFAPGDGPLDLGQPRGADGRSVFADHARQALGGVRVAVGNRLRRRAMGRRLGRRRGASRDDGSGGARPADALSAAPLATGADGDRGARRLCPGIAASPGAAARVDAAADGGLGRGADPRGGREARAALASAATDDGVGPTCTAASLSASPLPR